MNLPTPATKRNSKPGRAVIVERQSRALGLRIEGCTYRQIAAKLGCSDYTAIKDVKFCLENLVKHSAEKTLELREINNLRLETVIKTLWQPMKAGNLWAIDRFLAAIDQHSKLNGLNRPVPKVISGDPDNPVLVSHQHDIDAQLLARMRKLAGLDSPPSDEKIIDVTPPEIPGE
jgi:hypothetical protein